jgi:hypothetical protein
VTPYLATVVRGTIHCNIDAEYSQADRITLEPEPFSRADRQAIFDAAYARRAPNKIEGINAGGSVMLPTTFGRTPVSSRQMPQRFV